MPGFDVTFTGPDGTLLSAYTGDDGTTFTQHSLYSGLFKLLSGHATTPSGGSPALWYANWVPAGTDYGVSAAMYIASTQVSRSGPAIRIDPTAKTFYYTRFRTGLVELMRVVAGTQQTLIGPAFTLVSGASPLVEVNAANGASSVDLTVDIDGVRYITYSDVAANRITAAGRAGMYWDNGAVGDGTGQAFDTLSAADAGGGPSIPPQFLTASFLSDEMLTGALITRRYASASFEENELLRAKLQGSTAPASSFNVGLMRRSRRRGF